MDIREEDLPYGLRRHSFSKSWTKSSPFHFTKSFAVREEGSKLLAALTGVQPNQLDSSVCRQRLPKCGRQRCCIEQEIADDKVAKNDDSHVVKSSKSDTKRTSSVQRGNEGTKRCAPDSRNLMRWRPSSKQILETESVMVDEAVDTEDLEALLLMEDVKGDACSVDDCCSDNENIADGWKVEESKKMQTNSSSNTSEFTYRQFRERIKKTLMRIGVRTQMLQELKLGEVESQNSSPSPRPDASQLTVGKPEAMVCPYMSEASLVMKQARRLAGLIHNQEQAIDLQDVVGWLRHLGIWPCWK